jgi:carbon monoxide dehydrogenase subunit G
MTQPAGGFSVERTFEVPRSPTEVFDVLADTANFRAVDPALVEYTPTGLLHNGLEGTFAHRRGWMVARTAWKVRKFEPPRSVVVELTGMGYGMTEEATLEPTAHGTRLTFAERVWPTSVGGRVLVALSGGVMRRDLRARSQRLEALLTGSPDRGA